MTEKRLKLRFSVEAREDLRAITRYTIYKFGVPQAKLYGQSLTEIIEKLLFNPNLAVFRPELDEGLRSIVHKSHVIYFLVDAGCLTIVRILHQSRDVQRYF